MTNEDLAQKLKEASNLYCSLYEHYREQLLKKIAEGCPDSASETGKLWDKVILYEKMSSLAQDWSLFVSHGDLNVIVGIGEHEGL